MELKNISPLFIISIAILSLFLIAFITVPYNLADFTDVKDYSDTAKFFAGEYKAKIRTSHSLLYGLMLTPYVKLTNNFFLLKFASAIWLSLLILSIYHISGKNKKTLYLILACPLIWYMSPWLSPLPLVSLLFLWAYYYIKKFDSEEKFKHLFYSGLLIGLASALWDTAFYVSFIFLLAFTYDKKLHYSILFFIAVFIGMIPNLIVNQMAFGFPLYSLAKHFLAVMAFAIYNGAYEQGYSNPSFKSFFIILLFIPFYFYIFFKKNNFIRYSKEVIFISLTFLFTLTNPQLRLIILFTPIIILLLGKELNNKQLKKQVFIFILLSLLTLSIYIVQISYDTNARSIEKVLGQFPDIEFYNPPQYLLIKSDLDEIALDYTDQVFVVGNTNDDYGGLAHLYWGNKIKEFISIEDYNLFLLNSTTIASKKISSNSLPEFRREIWFEVGLGKNSNDPTDYEFIRYGISTSEDLALQDFKFKKKYRVLSVFEKGST